MSAPAGPQLRSDPYQVLESKAATIVSDSDWAFSPASDRERSEPISKMRRRWQPHFGENAAHGFITDGGFAWLLGGG